MNLPAIAGDDDPIGRAPGEALWPERFSVEDLQRTRADVGPYVWNALYQGRPTDDEGGIFRGLFRG